MVWHTSSLASCMYTRGDVRSRDIVTVFGRRLKGDLKIFSTWGISRKSFTVRKTLWVWEAKGRYLALSSPLQSFPLSSFQWFTLCRSLLWAICAIRGVLGFAFASSPAVTFLHGTSCASASGSLRFSARSLFPVAHPHWIKYFQFESPFPIWCRTFARLA